MFTSTHYSKVFKAVIKAITIDMMNNPSFRQWAIGVFPDYLLFGSVLANGNIDRSVSLVDVNAASPRRAITSSSILDITGPTAWASAAAKFPAINTGILPPKIVFPFGCGYLFGVGSRPCAVSFSVLFGVSKAILSSCCSSLFCMPEIVTPSVLSHSFRVCKAIASASGSLAGELFFSSHETSIAG